MNIDGIEYSEITTEKLGKVWVAKTIVKSLRTDITMQGKSQDIAIKKLKLFLEGKPYSHLDK